MTSASDSDSKSPVSFANDIMPMFQQFRAQMMWRFDLTDYEQVKASAHIILGRIDNPGNPMPPPPFPPLTAAQIQSFKDWMNGGYHP